MLSPQDLGVILSYRCLGKCKHCLYNCGPRRGKEAMSPEMLREALEVAAGLPRKPQVHLTGGEPFLHFPLLIEGARIAAELGIRCYFETGASWSANRAEAVERFTALRDAGMWAALISCSPFHAERIPPIHTISAVRAALEVFGPGRVIVYLPDFIEIVQMFDVYRPVPLEQYEEKFGAETARRILWEGYGIISGGRAGYRLGHLVQKHPAASFAGENCTYEILYAHHSHLDLYGNFIPAFCGGLAVGDWHRLPALSEDLASGRCPELLGLLIKNGPYGLFELARERYGYRPLPDGYAGKCHLCADVRLHLLEKVEKAGEGEFPELQPHDFYENF